MELRHLLDTATKKAKHFEDMSTINGEKLMQTEQVIEVLQSELKCAHDRLGTVEKELEISGVREKGILEKLQSVEEQLEQYGRTIELANARVLDFEACNESVTNALELKLQEATASLNLKESEVNQLTEKLVSLNDQSTAYQVLATKATGEVVSMKVVLEANAMRITTLENNLEELGRKISGSEAKSEQFIFENDVVVDKNSKLQEELVAYQSKVNELLNTIQAEKEISTVMEENNLLNHFQVPNYATSGLTFGSFHVKCPAVENSSTSFSDLTRDVVDISLSIHDESPTGRRSPSLTTGQDTMMLPALTDLSLQEISTVMEDNCLLNQKDQYTTREHQAKTVLFEEQIGEQKTVDMSKSSSDTMTWEITTSRPQKNQEVLQLSECQHVILPHHFEVPNLEISGLSFGDFNAGFLRDTTLAKGSTPFSDLIREVEEISSRTNDETSTAHGKGHRSPSLATGQGKMMLPAPTELSLQEHTGGLKSDSPDCGVATEGTNHENQHAKMKLIALRRAEEMQQEEEERKRVQKARSVAKLEELQRRTWKQSSQPPKVQYLPRGVSQCQWRVKANNNN